MTPFWQGLNSYNYFNQQYRCKKRAILAKVKEGKLWLRRRTSYAAQSRRAA